MTIKMYSAILAILGFTMTGCNAFVRDVEIDHSREEDYFRFGKFFTETDPVIAYSPSTETMAFIDKTSVERLENVGNIIPKGASYIAGTFQHQVAAVVYSFKSEIYVKVFDRKSGLLKSASNVTLPGPGGPRVVWLSRGFAIVLGVYRGEKLQTYISYFSDSGVEVGTPLLVDISQGRLRITENKLCGIDSTGKYFEISETSGGLKMGALAQCRAGDRLVNSQKERFLLERDDQGVKKLVLSDKNGFTLAEIQGSAIWTTRRDLPGVYIYRSPDELVYYDVIQNKLSEITSLEDFDPKRLLFSGSKGMLYYYDGGYGMVKLDHGKVVDAVKPRRGQFIAGGSLWAVKKEIVERISIE